jgi:hypothetical protein
MRRLKGPRTLIAVVGLVAAGLAFVAAQPATPAAAIAQPTGYVNQIFPVSSGRTGSAMCIDIPYSSWNYGEQLIQWGCTGNPNQSWRIEPSNGAYRIVSNMNNYCLDIPYSSTAWGVGIIQYPCHGGWNQTFVKIDHGHGTMSYYNANSNLCIDVSGYGQNWGAPLIQWGCYYTDNQQETSTVQPAFGYIDVLTGVDGGIEVQGWTLAANAPPWSLGYQVLVDGSPINNGYITAGAYRPDVGAAFPGYGNYHGINAEFTYPLIAGQHTVCVQSQSYATWSTIACGGFQYAATNSGGFLGLGQLCRMTQRGTIILQNEGVSSGSTDYFSVVVSAANRWQTNSSNYFQFTPGVNIKPRLRVSSGRFGTSWYGQADYNCGGLGIPYVSSGLGVSASSKRLRMNEQAIGANSNTALETAIHEVGHALGLDHNSGSSVDTVMGATGLSPANLPNYPTSIDVQNAIAKYP